MGVIRFVFHVSEMTLNYRMTVEKYSNLNGGVASVIHGCEIFFLLDKKNKSPSTAR